MELLVVFLFVSLVLMSFLYYRKNKWRDVENPFAELKKGSLSHKVDSVYEPGVDMTVLDESGYKIIESREIHQIPRRANRLNLSGSSINRIQHLTSDLFKGAVSTANKTTEVVFRQNIQSGLKDGSYKLMETKSGEILADAVDSTGKIVGKGRVVEGGKSRQILSGAFQLVSIAVAQSHLADIERSLSTINNSISDVLENQENEEKAKIKGAVDYLDNIYSHMKSFRCPDELAVQKKNAIEVVIKDSYAWLNKLEMDISCLNKKINDIKSSDYFGTGSTYKELESLIEKVKPLLKRREIYLDFVSATNFVTAYLDPLEAEFSRPKINHEKWSCVIEELRNTILKKKDELMNSKLNSTEMLGLRKFKIDSLSSEIYRISGDQQRKCIQSADLLKRSVNELIGSDGSVRVAISFDAKGEVREAAIV